MFMTQNIWGPVINEIWDKYDDNKPLKPRHAKNTSTLPYLSGMQQVPLFVPNWKLLSNDSFNLFFLSSALVDQQVLVEKRQEGISQAVLWPHPLTFKMLFRWTPCTFTDQIPH